MGEGRAERARSGIGDRIRMEAEDLFYCGGREMGGIWILEPRLEADGRE